MKVVLFDRDGTLIIDPPDERVDRIYKIKLFPDTISSLKSLAENNFAIIIITNQAAIAEGRISHEEFETINNKLIEMLEWSGIKVLKTYMSPEGSNTISEWRKPGPGMLLAAAKDYDLVLHKTFMVGDRQSDVLAGKNAGARSILVKTANKNANSDDAEFIAQNLSEATEYIISNS